MLSLEHLAVVRAALRYFDEGIVPHGDYALNDYLDLEGKRLDVRVEHIVEAGSLLQLVDLNYALVDSTGVRIESDNLFPANSRKAKRLRSELSLIAAVLVPVQPPF